MNKLYQLSQTEETIAILSNLEDKPKTEFTADEIVKKLKKGIDTAIKKQYTYKEIAKILSENGCNITATALKKSHLHLSSTKPNKNHIIGE